VTLLTNVSIRVVARMKGLHLIGQSRVVASGVTNLVLRVQITFRIQNSTYHYTWWFVTRQPCTCFYELWLVDGGTTSCGLW